MFVLLFVSTLALFFTYLESIGKIKHGLWIGMSLVTVIAAIHYNFGSDYEAYHLWFLDTINNRVLLQDLLYYESGLRNEPGWVLLMLLFKPFGAMGFYVMVATLSIFQGVVVYGLIKKYLPAQLYVFALFIYLFNTNIYVGSLSGMRQHFAVALTACTLPLILNKKWIHALLVILIASTIHMSAIMFLPFAFWGFIPNNRRTLITIYSLIFIVLLISKGLVQTIVDLFFTNNIGNLQVYESYTEDTEVQHIGTGFLIKTIIPFVLSLLYIIKNSDKIIFKIIALATISIVMIPITVTIPLTIRMAYYFEIFSIISIPYCFGDIKDRSIRIPISALYIFMVIYSYYEYFHSEIRYESTYIYHSILELLY